jgi:hypothetical protein
MRGADTGSSSEPTVDLEHVAIDLDYFGLTLSRIRRFSPIKRAIILICSAIYIPAIIFPPVRPYILFLLCQNWHNIYVTLFTIPFVHLIAGSCFTIAVDIGNH